MESINQLTVNLMQTTLNVSDNKSRVNTAKEVMQSEQFHDNLNLVITLFERWTNSYGAKLQGRQNLSLQAAETWAAALTLMSMTFDEFEQAIIKSLCYKWPPTAPYDFLALVRNDPASQYPVAEEAFDIACSNCGMKGDVKRNWKHGVIYETANRIGWGKLASAEDDFISTFKSIYEQVCNEYTEGNTFVIPKDRRLPYEHTVIQPDSEMNSEIDDFFVMFGSKAVAE